MMHKKKNKMTLLIFTLLLIIIAGVSVVGIVRNTKEESFIQGEIEFTELRISGKVAGRIDSFWVEEGDYIRAGDTLVVIQSPEIEAKLHQAEAAEKAAFALNQKAENGLREESLNAAFEMWQKAVAGAEIARKSYNRMLRLHEKKVISTQKLDEAEANYKAMMATEKAAKYQYDLAKKGSYKEDKQSAMAQLERAHSVVNEVRSYLDETLLTSPIAGKVGTIFPLKEELVGQGAPIMNIIDTTKIFVIFSIRESDYPILSVGKVIKGYIPALNNQEIYMKVTSAKDLGNFAAWKATKQTGELDSKTFEIKAVPQKAPEGLISGMSVIIKK